MPERDRWWVMAMFARKSRPRGIDHHEAGHAVAARALGAKGVRARVASDGTGYTRYRFKGARTDEVLIVLAGGEAARRATGDPCVGKGRKGDTALARRLLRGSGMSMRQAEREAARLVHENRRAVGRSAQRLNRRGRL